MGVIRMQNIKEFKKLVKSLPKNQQAILAEKIRSLVNTPTSGDFLKALTLGVYLDLNHEISLLGYVKNVPPEISADGHYATTIRDEHSSEMIIGESGEIESTVEFKHPPWFP